MTEELLGQVLTPEAVQALAPVVLAMALVALVVVALADYLCNAIKARWVGEGGARHWTLTLLPLLVGALVGLAAALPMGDWWMIAWGLLWGAQSTWAYRRLRRLQEAALEKLQKRVEGGP